MNRILKMLWIDLKTSRLLFLLPVGVMLGFYGMTLFIMKPLSGQMKAWRFGYLGQEFLIVLFLFWSIMLLQRWFGQEEAESLRGTAQHHSCLSSLLLVLGLEFFAFLPGIAVGFLFHVNYLWEVTRIMIYQVMINALVYILACLLKNVFFPLLLAVSYCLICDVFGGNNSRLLLIHPGVGEAADYQTVLSLWPYLLAAAVLLFLADKLDRRMLLIS